MIHSSYYKPRVFPFNGDVADAEIDRAQAIDPTVSLNREKIEEIGNPNIVGYIKKTPTIGYRLTQLEYGSMEFWRKLTNKADSVLTLDLDDFKTSTFDICAYLTDDDGTFKGTVWYPKLRTSGFSVTIGDTDAIIERGFDFVGEKAVIWQGDNKYFIYNEHTAASGSDDDIDLSAKAPAEDPDNSGQYMLRVLRVRGSATTELVETTDYTYTDGTKILHINSIQTDDVIKAYYTSATAPDAQFTPNTSDPAGILADSCDIYVYIPASGKPSSSDYMYRVQSATIDVSFDREDVKEIGNREVVKRGIRDKTVTVTLGRLLEEFTMEEVLRGVASGYGKIDVEEFTDQATVIIKVYEDSTKTTFKYGIKATGLTGSELRGGAGINAYVNKENALEGEALVITSDAGELGI
jgi:hypothetical protein